MRALFIALLLAVLPKPGNGQRVVDGAHVLSSDQVQRLIALSDQVERSTTAELAVVTVPDLDGKTVDEYAHELFNEWGIGKKGVNNGVLFLVAPRERRMRIEVGYGLESLLTDSLCGQIRDSSVVPYFRGGDVPTGIITGTHAIADLLQKNPQAAHGVAGSLPPYFVHNTTVSLGLIGAVAAVAVGLLSIAWMALSRRNYSKFSIIVGTAALLIIVLLAVGATLAVKASLRPTGWLSAAGVAAGLAWIYSFFKFRRFGPHACPACGSRLVLLDEAKDDEKLDQAQRLEEQIGSVDYDVWVCPGCLRTDTERYVKSFSGFGDCPACSRRTLKSMSHTIVPATTLSTGTRQIDERCVSCKYANTRYAVIPRISTSSSSGGRGFGGGGGGGSSGGFGGGSSGGGGASGGW